MTTVNPLAKCVQQQSDSVTKKSISVAIKYIDCFVKDIGYGTDKCAMVMSAIDPVADIAFEAWGL